MQQTEQITQRTCMCHESKIADIGTKWSLEVQRSNKSFDIFSEEPILSIPVIYHVLYNTEQENISIEKIRDNHLQLNLCFQAKNEDIDKVPNSGDYNFLNMVGNPRIGFLPEDENSITDMLPYISRTQTTKESLSSIEEIISLRLPIAGYLNVYIANLTNNILGVASLGSNICAVNYNTVGGPQENASLSNFQLGRTLVHEVGHCFTLLHPWDSDCIITINDLPKTKNPNYNATLEPEAKLGNHWTDVEQITVDKSCTGNQNPPIGYYELFMTYMEYVTDKNMVMFTEGQSKSMHVWLDTSGRELFSVFTEGIVFTEPPFNFTPTPSNSSSSLSNSTIVLIVLSVLIFIVLLSLMIYFVVRKRT